MQTPRTTTHLHIDPCARPRSSYCIVGDLTARLWWPYGDPAALLYERWATAFVLSMLIVRAVAWLSMRSHSVYWRRHCVAAVMLAIVLCAPRRFAFFLDAVGSPWDRRENAALVWQGFKRPFQKIARKVGFYPQTKLRDITYFAIWKENQD